MSLTISPGINGLAWQADALKNLHHLSRAYLETITQAREPDEWIGGRADPYMKRWHLNPNRQDHEAKVYLHEFFRSDDDRALHDHPADSISFMVRGMYREWLFSDPGRAFSLTSRDVKEGSIIYRPAAFAHRLEVFPDQVAPLSVFIMGPSWRRWGFHCPQGWRDYADYIQVINGENTVGRGCD